MRLRHTILTAILSAVLVVTPVVSYGAEAIDDTIDKSTAQNSNDPLAFLAENGFSEEETEPAIQFLDNINGTVDDTEYNDFATEEEDGQESTTVEINYDKYASVEDFQEELDGYILPIVEPADDMIEIFSVPVVAEAENLTYSGVSAYANSNYNTFIQSIRDHEVNRDSAWNIEYEYNTGKTVTEDNKDELFYSFIAQMQSDIVKHTGVPEEGDYLYCVLSDGYINVAWQWGEEGDPDDLIRLNMEFYDCTYKTTKEQETAVTQKVDSMIEDFNWEQCEGDYKKVKDVYDYLCANVTYDDNYATSGLTTFTAYGALINGTSVCQGYASAFYRIILEEDIDCRIILGQTSIYDSTAHSWNIVELDNKYYNLDSTWDAGKTDYEYFLLDNSSFKGSAGYHLRDDEYDSSSFNSEYLMSTSNYDPFTAASAGKQHTVVTDAAVAATCTTVGLTAGSHCSKCGEVFTAQEIIPALGHDMEYNAATQATSSEDGNIAYMQCLTCYKYFDTDEEEIEYEDTILHNKIFIEAEKPTETSEGNIAYYVCENCGTYFNANGDIITFADTIIPALSESSDETTDSDNNTNDDVTEVTPDETDDVSSEDLEEIISEEEEILPEDEELIDEDEELISEDDEIIVEDEELIDEDEELIDELKNTYSTDNNDILEKAMNIESEDISDSTNNSTAANDGGNSRSLNLLGADDSDASDDISTLVQNQTPDDETVDLIQTSSDGDDSSTSSSETSSSTKKTGDVPAVPYIILSCGVAMLLIALRIRKMEFAD